MERLLDFEFETTRYLVWRQWEWGFFVSVAGAEGAAVNVDVEFMYRDMPGLRNPQRTLVAEGVAVAMDRLDGSEEEVTILLDELHESHVVLRFELADDVQLELVDKDTDAAEGER